MWQRQTHQLTLVQYKLPSQKVVHNRPQCRNSDSIPSMKKTEIVINDIFEAFIQKLSTILSKKKNSEKNIFLLQQQSCHQNSKRPRVDRCLDIYQNDAEPNNKRLIVLHSAQCGSAEQQPHKTFFLHAVSVNLKPFCLCYIFSIIQSVFSQIHQPQSIYYVLARLELTQVGHL